MPGGTWEYDNNNNVNNVYVDGKIRNILKDPRLNKYILNMKKNGKI